MIVLYSMIQILIHLLLLYYLKSFYYKCIIMKIKSYFLFNLCPLSLHIYVFHTI